MCAGDLIIIFVIVLVRYEEAVEFMRAGASVEVPEVKEEESDDAPLFDENNSPFFGGTIEPM